MPLAQPARHQLFISSTLYGHLFMAKYKCPTLGDCDKANSAEIFERAPGEDVKCPQCGTLLEPQDAGMMGGTGTRANPAVKIAIGVAALLALSTGGFMFWQLQTKPREIAFAPEPMAVAAAPSPMASVAIPPAATTGIAPSDEETKALRVLSDANLAAGKAAEAEASSSKAASNELLKSAIAKMSQGKLDEAERDLTEARLRSPQQTLIPYNMAVLRLKQNRTEDALRELESSFKGGFAYYDKMDEDSDLKSLRADPRFTSLVAQYRPAAK
jgi:hypothetical protein